MAAIAATTSGRRSYGWVRRPVRSALVCCSAVRSRAPPPVYYEPQPAYDAAEAYCIQRFKSYDPASGTISATTAYGIRVRNNVTVARRHSTR